MTQPAKVQEPSMEEILASIRRIIADDEAKPAAAEKPASPAAGREAGRDEGYPAVGDCAGAEAGSPRRSRPPPPPAARARAGRQQQPGRHRRDAGEPRRGDARGRHQAGAARARGRRVRTHRRDGVAGPPAPAAAVVQQGRAAGRSSNSPKPKASRRQPAYEPPFESAAPPRPMLSHSTVSAVESAFNSLANTVLSNNARTLEDLVKEMLRPMLKSWLDDNLPGLVERIVKAEIERVSRGGR